MAKIVFLNQVKKNRADGILAVLAGKPAPSSLKSEYSPEGIQDLTQKFAVMLKDEGIKDLSSDEAVLFVYEKLGGGIKTYEEVQKAKAKAAKKKGKAADDEDETPASTDDEGDDE